MDQIKLDLATQMEQMEALAIQIALVMKGYYSELCKAADGASWIDRDSALQLTMQFQEMWL